MADEKHISFGNLAKFKEKYDEKLSDELTSRVDVVEGKGLSTNDFTNELKATLESALQANALTDYAKKTDISSVFKYKGSVENYSDLPTEENTIGDTYDIINADAEHNIDAGDNLTWNGESWDNLSGVVNLNPINTKLSEMETSIDNIGKVEFASDEDINSLFEIFKGLVLTDSKYKMSDIYPDNYQTMTKVPDKLDTSNVTGMFMMFNKCFNLTAIPELNTDNVISMIGMFYNCKSLTSIPQLNTSNVIGMWNMFDKCTSLPSEFPWIIDCGSISESKNIEEMFQGSSVTKVILSNVKEDLKSQITSQLLKGDDTLTIEFV